MANESHLLAIDVGSSRVKLGWFPAASPCEGERPASLAIAAPPLAIPAETCCVEHRDRSAEEWTAAVDACFHDLPPTGEICCAVASVHRGVAEKLLTRLQLRAEIHRLWKKEGMTILFVTHDVEEALQLADRIVVMSPRPGRIQEIVEVGLPHPRGSATPGWAEKEAHLYKLLGVGR